MFIELNKYMLAKATSELESFTMTQKPIIKYLISL